MTSVHERDDRQIQSVHAPGAGHSMTAVIEESTQRGLIHGEMAALGAVLDSWITGHADRMMDMLDRCHVRYRPTEIGLTKDETRKALALALSYFSSRDTDTVLAREPIVGKGFEEVWKFLENRN